MNVHDLPMVIFTVFSQMSVGTFITLGVINLLTARRHDRHTVERVVTPALYAIGPALVFGLAVSMLHMNDVTNTFNVIRHWDSSWLSREIIFGISFAAFGFLFALLEWFKKGSHVLRQVIAGIAAVLGIGLLWAESSVYASLVAVPAWNTWVVPVQFFATAALLGVLAVGAALMVTTVVRQRTELGETIAEPVPETDPEPAPAGGLMVQVRKRVEQINAPTSAAEWDLTVAVIKGMAFAGTITSVLILAVYPLYLAELTTGNAAAQASAAVFSGAIFWVRLALAGITAIILGFFVHRMASPAALAAPRRLVTMVLVSFFLALTGELLGRLLHYAAMIRVGI